MTSKQVVIGSSVGLHARPAALFVQAVARQPVKVRIAKAGAGSGAGSVDARSILSVLALDARNGDEVVLSTDAEGDDATHSLEELATLLARDLDQEP
jgi:phosphocarrier protein HPr